jgi:hypothetical protein
MLYIVARLDGTQKRIGRNWEGSDNGLNDGTTLAFTGRGLEKFGKMSR